MTVFSHHSHQQISCLHSVLHGWQMNPLKHVSAQFLTWAVCKDDLTLCAICTFVSAQLDLLLLKQWDIFVCMYIKSCC